MVGRGFTASFSLKKNGFLLFGLLKSVDTANDIVIRPNIISEDLINPERAKLIFEVYHMEIIEGASETRKFSITSLDNEQMYTMYWMALEENPSSFALKS